MKIDYLKLLHETEEKANLNEAGKKWPEDYVKTAKNNILNSPLGKTFWYKEEYIDQDLKNISIDFEPLAKKNTNLGYFALIIRWFIEYSGSDPRKYQDFFERKLDGILRTILWLTNNPPEYDKVKDVLKSWSFKEWEPFQKSIEEKIEAEQEEKLKNLKVENNGFEIIPIASFDDFHEKFGDDKTGLQGKYTWCHANEPRTYDNWVKKDDDTGKNKYIFFVIAKKGWESIKPPDPPPDQKTGDAYDEYGTSLIAILVDTETRKLRNATLRWNHAVHPANTRMGVSDDMAFLGWGDLSEETGINIKTEINKILDKAKEDPEINESYLKDVDYYDLYKKIQEDAMFSGIDGSSIGAGDIVGADLPDEFDAEVHTNGATSPSKSILPKIQKYVSGKGGFFGPDDFTLAKNIFNKVQKRYKEQMKAMRKFAVGKQCLTCEDIFFGLGLSEEQAKELCKKHFEHAVSENNANAKLVDLAFYGSRTKGTEREDSDLDVVVQYSGPEREDTMFEILNSEDGEFGRFSIGGFIVDFNPIKGPIDEFLAKAARY